MKTIAFFLLLAVSLLSSAVEPDSKALGQCPYGHKTLKDIPILYGLPPFGGPELKRYNEGLAAGKFVSGSDVIFGDSARIQVTCMTCGYEHTQSAPDFGTWLRSSTDRKSFQEPLSEMLTTFPTPPPKKVRGRVLYTQYMDDKFHVFAELVMYNSAESLDGLRARIEAWLKARHIVAERKTTHVKASERRFGATDGTRWVSDLPSGEHVAMGVSFEHKDGRCYVDFSRDTAFAITAP